MKEFHHSSRALLNHFSFSTAHAASTSEDAVEKPPAKKSKTDSPTEPSESAPDSSSTSSVSEVEMKEAAAPAPQV